MTGVAPPSRWTPTALGRRVRNGAAWVVIVLALSVLPVAVMALAYGALDLTCSEGLC